MIPIQIRVARREDCSDILRIRKEGMIATYVNSDLGITEQDVLRKDFDSPAVVAQFERRIAGDPNSCLWVADANGQVVGVCRATKGERENKVSGLYVTRSFQGRMLGKRLTRVMLEWCGSEKPIVMSVVSYNPIVRIYKRFDL